MMLYQDQLVLILNPSWVLGESSGVVPVPIGRSEQLSSVISLAVGESC
jgi:hypothetical protein